MIADFWLFVQIFEKWKFLQGPQWKKSKVPKTSWKRRVCHVLKNIRYDRRFLTFSSNFRKIEISTTPLRKNQKCPNLLETSHLWCTNKNQVRSEIFDFFFKFSKNRNFYKAHSGKNQKCPKLTGNRRVCNILTKIKYDRRFLTFSWNFRKIEISPRPQREKSKVSKTCWKRRVGHILTKVRYDRRFLTFSPNFSKFLQGHRGKNQKCPKLAGNVVFVMY